MNPNQLFFLTLFTSLVLLSIRCSQVENTDEKSGVKDSITLKTELKPFPIAINADLHDSSFVNVRALSDNFVFDMRYASENNFLGEKVYPCSECLLRYKVYKKLLSANIQFQSKGYQIKFFDCFRPASVQLKMWKIMPDSKYVANPYKSGSVHNRGAAIDITLTTLTGEELDMGTEFDHFGVEASHKYQQLPDTVLKNRQYLKKTMIENGFNTINSEWWHYTFGDKENFPISQQSLCH